MTMLGILGIDLGRGDQTARLYRCDCCGWTPRPVARMLRRGIIYLPSHFVL